MQNEKDRTNTAQRIVKYWSSVERFTIPRVETQKKIGYIKSIQQETLGAKDIPWQSRSRFQHRYTPNHTLVYTVFLGIIKHSDISSYITKRLNGSDEYNDDLNANEVSCLCSFQLSNYGELLAETFTIPDYFVYMSCLNQIDRYPNDWVSLAPQFTKKFNDIFDNQCDVIKNRINKSFTFDDLKEILYDMVGSSRLIKFLNLISNTAVIYTSEVPVTNKFRHIENKKEAKSKFHNIEYYEEILQETIAPDYNILNSFYINDLDMVSNSVASTKHLIGTSLKEYLNINKTKNKLDIRSDIDLVKEYSDIAYIPPARWPSSPQYPLSLTQQIAVNLALNSDEGLFSVNGPPGTGKSTLLRDIIAGVVFKRANALSKFDNPSDAFKTSTSISIERYSYCVWNLDESLLGYEMVISSTNNAAVENISKEIPQLSEISNEYHIDYFAEIASHVLNEGSWGLGSAVLGNKANCTKFFNSFWNKVPDKDLKDKSYGLNYLLNDINPQSNWLDCRDKFLATKEKYDNLVDELNNFRKALIDLKFIKNEIYMLEAEQDEQEKQIITLEISVIDYNNQLQLVKNSINNKNNQLKSVAMLKPAWYIVLIDALIRGSNYKDWHTKCINLIDDVNKLSEEKEIISTTIKKLENDIIKLKDDWRKLDDKRSENHNKLLECEYIIDNMNNTHQFYSPANYDDLWSLPDSELQLTSPWIHHEIQNTRAELFISAMNLHKSFILNSSNNFSNNLKALKYMATSGFWPSKLYDLLPHMWATFFMVVPTISTTFASFANLFGNMNANSIGYLLVDEAGQSAPQVAAGAIYRTKRAIIVGDPMQIQPVVTIPKGVNQALLNYYNVESSWDILEESVQTLADKANRYGTVLSQNGNSKWIGCPLRAHRRCMDPMFSVSNAIAYNNSMFRQQAIKHQLLSKYFIKVCGLILKEINLISTGLRMKEMLHYNLYAK